MKPDFLVVYYSPEEANDSAGSAYPPPPADQGPSVDEPPAYPPDNPHGDIPPWEAPLAAPGFIGPPAPETPPPVVPAPPPIVPYTGGGRGASPYSAPAPTQAPTPAPAAPADPAQAAYDAIPQAYRNILEDLEHTWQLQGGFVAPVSKQNIVDMAGKHVVSISDFGKWMWDNGRLSDDVKKGSPWLGVGLSQGEYVKATNAYTTQWMKLTGQQADLTGIGYRPPPANGTPDTKGFVWDALRAASSPADFADIVTQDNGVRDTYKWLQHGIDYQQFQVKKQDMALAFGSQLSNDQAVLQLTYWQRFTDGFGENQAIHAQNQDQGAGAQALTQGAVGVSGTTQR